MRTQVHESSCLRLLIAGIAVVLFGAAGIARMMGWGPTFTDGSHGLLVPDAMADTTPLHAADEVPAKARCAECGVVVSMREVTTRDENTGSGAAGGVAAGRDEARAKSISRHEIVVRMADGSSRVIDDASPGSWRVGERMIVIDGRRPSHQ